MNVDRLIVAIAILFGAAYFYQTGQIELLAFGDPIGPRVFPYMIGTIFLIGAVVLGFETLRKPVPEKAAASTPPLSPAEKHINRRIYWMIAAVSAWILLYIFAFERAGYVLSSIVFLVGLTFYFHPRKWVTNSAVSVLLPVGTYLVFHNLLHVGLPAGILPL